MAELCLSEEYISVDFSGHKVWYDEANKQLILLKNNVYFTLKLSLGLGSRLSSPINFVHAGNVLDVKFSLCRKFMAIQRSDMEIEIVDIERVAEWRLSCRSKRGNCVIRGGMLWLINPKEIKSKSYEHQHQHSHSHSHSHTNLAMVTRFGLEIHRLPNRSRNESNCKLLSTVKYTVQCFWHLPQHQVILLATDTGQELRPFQFQDNVHPTKLAKFCLNSMPAQRDIMLAKIYDSIFCINIDAAGLCMRLFRIGRQETQCTHVLRLHSTGSFGISVLDNLLCLHNMDAKMSIVYDIRANTNFPCLVPAPLNDKIANQDHQDDEKIVNVKVDSTAIGLEFGPHEPKEKTDETFAVSVTKVSSGEASVSKVEVGDVLISINGKSVENLGFDDAVSLLQQSSRPVFLQFRSFTNVKGNDAILPINVDNDNDKYNMSINAENDNTEQTQDDEYVSSRGHAELYAPSWVFLPPYWVLDARLGRIWRLEINLDAASREVGLKMLQGQKGPEKVVGFLGKDPRNLCDFLLRRTTINPTAQNIFRDPIESVFSSHLVQPRAYSKAVLLQLIHAHLSQGKHQLMTVSMLFKSMNDAYLMALRERSIKTPQQRTIRGLSERDPKSTFSIGEPTPTYSNSGSDLNDTASTISSASTSGSTLTANQRLSLLRCSSFRRANINFELEEEESEVDLETKLLTFLDDFKGAEQVPLKDIRCFDGRAVVLQIDMFTWVFLKLIPATIDMDNPECWAKCDWLGIIVTEYVRSLHYHFIPVEQYIFELLSWILILCKQEQTLHQLLQYHIPYDSNRLAETLLRASVRYEPLWQVSVDMFYRLGEHAVVVIALLSRKKLFQALRLLMCFPKLLHHVEENSSDHNRNHDSEKTMNEASCIHPVSLFVIATKICKVDNLDWNIKVLTGLQSFFVSIRPSLVRPRSYCDENGNAHFECSPLAKAYQLKHGDEGLLEYLLGKKAGHVLRSFGFDAEIV